MVAVDPKFTFTVSHTKAIFTNCLICYINNKRYSFVTPFMYPASMRTLNL